VNETKQENPMTKTARYTLKDFNEQFPDDDSCLDFLFEARYPEKSRCPGCLKITKFHRIAGRKAFSCQFCGAHVFPTAGTIFHKSPTPLKSWFYAIFLMSSTRCGISAKQLQRELGVTYKTAWRMFTQIRMLMNEQQAKMSGTVEVDETYFGGKGHKQGRSTEQKTPVMGIVERGGELMSKVVPDVKARTLMPILWNQVPPDIGTRVYTDELGSYNYVAKLGYTHEKVEHAAKEYARGIVHVNTIEGLWSTIKRGIDGAHHAVSPKYLGNYLDEYGFRYNHRKSETPMFQLLLNRVLALIPSVVGQPVSAGFQMRLL
jgi:transposase